MRNKHLFWWWVLAVIAAFFSGVFKIGPGLE